MIRTKLEKDRTGLMYTFMGSISGLVACALMAMFESFYYSNRDVLYWVTINNSAVPGTLVILGLATALCIQCKLKRM
jgi:cell division protein FtsX